VARRARGWEERIADLEDRLAEVAAARNRPDPMVEAGLSEAEMLRAAELLGLSLEAEPPTREAASAGARWLHCWLQHGPGLCEADCKGEYRHRPERQPATLGSSPDDVRQAALIAQTGGEVPKLTSTPDELAERRDVERRDIFSPRFFPYGGAEQPSVAVAEDWTSPDHEQR
jgi:hypothetical protein